MNSKYLYSLINDILDYTEINLNGNLKLVYEKTQIKNLVEEVKLVLQFKAKSKEIDIVIDV